MYYNPNKTIAANEKGIIISYRDMNKDKWIPYEHKQFTKVFSQTDIKKSKYQNNEIQFNFKQHKLYCEALYGLDAYTKEEVEKMPQSLRNTIIVMYNKAQRILNNLKQEVSNKGVDNLMSILFPHSSFVKEFVKVNGYDPTTKNLSSFRELKITKEMIAKEFVKFRILPLDFFSIT
jgi:hypothetical protein